MRKKLVKKSPLKFHSLVNLKNASIPKKIWWWSGRVLCKAKLVRETKMWDVKQSNKNVDKNCQRSQTPDAHCALNYRQTWKLILAGGFPQIRTWHLFRENTSGVLFLFPISGWHHFKGFIPPLLPEKPQRLQHNQVLPRKIFLIHFNGCFFFH